MIKNRIFAFFIYLLVFCFITQKTFANISLISDDEIETSLKKLTTPLLIAAGFNPSDITIRLVQDKSANAFVADNKNIFLNTGLLIEFANSPEAILGVVAHEIGHIKAGHLLRNKEKIDQIRKATITSLILATAAAIAVGNPDGIAAAVAGSSHIGEREFLRHSRENEETADQIAINLLKKIQISPQGLIKILEYFKQRELAQYDKINPYTLTHPISRERLAFIKNAANNLNYTPQQIPVKTKEDFIRSMSKLKAFIDPSKHTLKKVVRNNDINNIYMRAIAFFKLPDLKQSLSLMQILINRDPNNPYFMEFIGQILFENGHINDSIKYYERANKLLPNANGIKLGLARALIHITDNNDDVRQNSLNLNQAILYLKQIINEEDDNLLALRLMAIAYGRQGQVGLANAFLAEAALLTGNTKDAIKFAKLASDQLPKNHPALFKVKDILNTVK